MKNGIVTVQNKHTMSDGMVDMLTRTKLPSFSKAQKLAAARLLAIAKSRSLPKVSRQKRRSAQITSKPILTIAQDLLNKYGLVSTGVDPLLARKYGICQKALPSGNRRPKAVAA